ncbi:MAG: ATP-binding cassette domain-containing protein [Gammaproteobacteria bacterium]|nr:ATP-binding cassette domain-containing protein [Gammaproteobacteria bacterium]MCY4356312.1 ATP-binding cassette domain-containing protein [Gammaproteobacteria bacterium]
MIEVENALCRVGRHAVLKVPRFSLHPGEHWCLYGPNGAGKTVLANLLVGKRTESGSCVRYGRGFDPSRHCLFVSFEEQQKVWARDYRMDMSEYSDDAMDKGTLVSSLISSARVSGNQDLYVMENLIERLDIVRLLDKGIRFLSSGQIRRVLIARALYAASATRARLLVLDDPLEAIDKESCQRIVDCIGQQQSMGYASLLLCRRQQDILSGVTHLALMQDLKILEQGERDAVLSGSTYSRLISRKPTLADSLPPAPAGSVSPTSTEQLIELDGVNVDYGEQPILRNICWVMTGADHVLIEGPNGCGKSTLLSLIDGENHKGYGQPLILFGHRKGSGETIWDIKSHFGVVSNELHNKYIKGWKVLDVVVSGFFNSVGLYDDSCYTQRDAARLWLEALGIKNLDKNYYHELSFGEQRLTLLARAMVKHPSILVLDEPCVGLDDYHRKLILGTLDLIASQTHTRIIYVSHVSDEQPDCITQYLRFVPSPGGGHTVVQQQ